VPECLPAVGAQVTRGFDKRAWYALKGGHDWEDHVWKPHIGKGNERAQRRNGERWPTYYGQAEDSVKQSGEAGLGEEPTDDALLGEDQLPGVDTHDVARPERHDHTQGEEHTHTGRGIARHEIGQWERQQSICYGNHSCHAGGAQHNVHVSRAEEVGVCLERELAHDAPGEVVQVEEALYEQCNQGTQVDNNEG
jgi:hypothetical protein